MDPCQRAVDDETLLDTVQRAAFDDFVSHTHLTTGLIADASRGGAPSSIAVVGFACSTYPIGVERGFCAGDGPTAAPINLDGRRQCFFGYAAQMVSVAMGRDGVEIHLNTRVTAVRRA